MLAFAVEPFCFTILVMHGLVCWGVGLPCKRARYGVLVDELTR